MAIGDRVFVYDAQSSTLLHALKGHTGNVYTVAYSKDGKRFASAGADNQVIIWSSKGEGLLRYPQKSSVQCLVFNPATHQLVSGYSNGYSLWTPDQKEVKTVDLSAKVLCASWTSDGALLAVGLWDGTVTIRSKEGESKCEIKRLAPVWTVEWNPVPNSTGQSFLAVGCWDQTLSFWDSAGQQQGVDKAIGFDPCAISFFSNGELMTICGSDKKATLWTKDGVCLGTIAEHKDWIWTATMRPKHNQVVVGCNDGTVASYQLTFTIVHGLYQDRYAYREIMTDVIIHNLTSEEKVRLKCRDLVKKIALYKNRLAVQLPDRIIIYSSSDEDDYDMRYKSYKKIQRKVDCSLMVLTLNHVILCHERRLQMLNFEGEVEREWVLDGLVRYIKAIGGPANREGLLVGLKTGHILKIFIDNPFPVTLIQQQTAIRCLDLSCLRKKVAAVDDNQNLSVYDISTQKLLFQDSNVTSVAWNSDKEDLLAYSGSNSLSIKTGEFPPAVQKMMGFVVGFKGSKIFALHYLSMNTIFVPQTPAMYKYLEMKEYDKAYDVACLGVTEQDWRAIAIECIQAHMFHLARKAFIRIKDVRFLELLAKIEQDRKAPGYSDSIMLGEVSAYQGRYNEAAALYMKSGSVDRVIDMYKELKQWDKVQEFMKKLDKNKQKELIEIRAGDTEHADWKVSAELFINVGDYKKAVQLIGSKGDLEWLIEICRQLSKAENAEAIQACATIFRQKGSHAYAKEALLKLGDIKGLLDLHIELSKWDEAFRLAKQNQELLQDLYLPYAKWLAANDRFEEAKEAFTKANRPDIALRLLERLTQNAVVGRKFTEAAYNYWNCALEHLGQIQDCMNPTQQCAEHFGKYEEYKRSAEIYFAYHYVCKFVEEPFLPLIPGTSTDEAIFNNCLFLMNLMGVTTPFGLNKMYIYQALGKIGRKLGAYKVARTAYEKLQSFKIPQEWQEEVDLSSLLVRSKPYMDREDLLGICNRCMNNIPLLNPQGIDACPACRHPVIRSCISGTPLPLVEFAPDPSLSSKQVDQLLKSDAPKRSGKVTRKAA